MRPQALVSLFLACAILFSPTPGLSFETDQYNLSHVPLADIGDEVSEYVEDALRTAIAKVNADIGKRVYCLETTQAKPKECSYVESEKKKLAYLRSNEAVVEAVYEALGKGNLFTTKFGNWMREHKFRVQPDRYKTSLGHSIYILNPANYLSISATVRLFGTEFGIDKLEHFFQQGHKYYEIEKKEVGKGRSGSEAVKKAVRWGQRTERTYYGLLASGVYSNADLYANYAGMRFYHGLTDDLQINGKTRPATLVLKDGFWTIDVSALRGNLIKPFLTDHLNEAFNPSAFRLTLVRSVRRAVKKYACPDWQRVYPDLTAADLTARSKALELWNGEDYGFTKKSRVVTIAGTCFDTDASADKDQQ